MLSITITTSALLANIPSLERWTDHLVAGEPAARAQLAAATAALAIFLAYKFNRS